MSESPLPTNRPLAEADILNLISIQARENRSIEFKSEYLPDSDSGKKKFLQSIASFANARGGDLLLGVQEENGVAAGINPLTKDPDQSRLQILDVIRVHLRPSLGGVQVVDVAVNGGHVFVIRIPKSWAGPHMLTYGDDRRFYIRGDGGKRPMDYEDVRDGFLGGENTAARIRNFRMERCAAILNDETPRQLSFPSRTVVHLVPFGSIAQPHRFEIQELSRKREGLLPLRHEGYGHGFDLDGIFAHATRGDRSAYSYATLFRSGAIEAVDASWLAPWRDNKDKGIPHQALELGVTKAVEGYLDLLTSLEVPLPYAVFITLLNVKGHYMISSPHYIDGGTLINRNHLYLPEIVLETRPASVATTLFPIFNSIWNACGLPQSRNYTENGKWNPRQ